MKPLTELPAWLIALVPAIFLLLWSGGYTVAKIGVGDADPLTLLAIRYGCVLLLLAPFIAWLRPPMPDSWRAWRDLVIVGFLIQVVYFGSAWSAFRLGTSASTVALITSLHPVLVAFVMPLVSLERVSRRRWSGIALGLLGTILVLRGNSTLQPVAGPGLILCCIALVSFSLATVWEKRFGIRHHPLVSNGVQYGVGFFSTLPLAWWLEPMQVTWTIELAWALAYLVIGNSILAISLLLMMIRQGEASRVSALFFLVPPVSALIAWLVIDETMALMAWAGMGVAAAGVWLATRSDR